MRSDCFQDELNLISDADLKAFTIAYLDKVVLPYFYVVPASSSGKYHPAYALGEGGLVRHTKACVKIAEDLLSLEQNDELDCYHDEIIIALLTHDTFKRGVKANGHTVFEHPIIASHMLNALAKEQYPKLCYRVSMIAKLVSCHMGQWNRSRRSNVILPKPQTNVEKFVHLCDYLASRDYILIDVKYEPSEEKESSKEE